MTNENKKILKGLVLTNLGFCIYLYIYIEMTGFDFARGMTWGTLTPINFVLGWTAYQLAIIMYSEEGNIKGVKKVNKIALALFILFILFSVGPFICGLIKLLMGSHSATS